MAIDQELWADLVLPASASPSTARPGTSERGVAVTEGETREQAPFLGESQQQAIRAIRRALTERHVFVALTGAPGLGKTTVLASAVTALPGRQLRTIRVVDPDWISAESAKQIEQVAFEPAERTTKGEPQTVVVIDDAHAASEELLRCLTRIAVRGWPDPRSPQVVMAGRPELWDRLAAAEFEPLVERITFRPVLQPLSDEDARAVIRYSLEQPRRISGQSLTGDAEQEVLRFAQGMPGRIGSVLSSALTLRDVETRLPVSAEMVRSAAAALEGVPRIGKREAFVGGRTLTLALLTAAIAAAGLVLNAEGWPPGRIFMAARDVTSRAVPWRTSPESDIPPVVAEASRRAPAESADTRAPSPPTTASPTVLPMEEPRTSQPLAQGTAQGLAAEIGHDGQPAPASPGEDDRPAAAASAPSQPASPPPVAETPPDRATSPHLAPASVPAPGPRSVDPGNGSPAPLSPKMVALLLQRGDEMLALGDYDAARHLYERTVSAGSAAGARNLARTYDPAFNRASGTADPAAAVTWYSVAAALGDADAAARLQQLKTEGGHRLDAPAPAQ